MIARSEARSRQIDELLASVRANAPERLRNTPGFRLLAGGGAPAQSGILPDASMEPMGYEPPPVTADYFATPAPTEYQDFAAPPPTEYRGFTPIAELRSAYDDFIRDQGLINSDYPELPTDEDFNAEYAGQLRRQAASEAQRSAGVLPTAGNEPRTGDYIPAREPYDPPPTLTEQDLVTLARAESMGAAPPALIAMFNGIPTGTPLSGQEAMILRALRQAAR